MQTPVIDVNKKPKENKIFLGEFGHFLRVDTVTHEIARKLKEQSEGNFWLPKVVPFDRDRVNFVHVPGDEQNAFKYNICYQNLMDSGVDSGYSTILKKLASSSIWSMLYGRIAIEEQIHAESYSYALNEMFGSKSTEILDLVYTDPFIKTRMESEVELFAVAEKVLLEPESFTEDEKKKAILRLLLGVYLLESVKFPFSFLVTFTINKFNNSAIQGVARLIRLIAHDELNIHVPTGKNVMNILRNEEEQEFSHLFKNGWFNDIAIEMTKEVVQQEIEWARYLLEGKSVRGLNMEISEHFIKYWAGVRLRDIGVKNIYNEPKSDIIDWFNDVRDINKQNVALQEAANISYQRGTLIDDLGDEAW